MNPEIHSIVEDMKKRCPKNPIANSDIQTYLSVQSSSLLVLLAEEAEKSAKKTEKLTGRILFLTWVIAILTAVLLFTVFFKFPKISIKLNQQPNQKTEQTQQNNTNKQLNEVNHKEPLCYNKRLHQIADKPGNW